jgi:hypothetical protein
MTNFQDPRIHNEMLSTVPEVLYIDDIKHRVEHYQVCRYQVKIKAHKVGASRSSKYGVGEEYTLPGYWYIDNSDDREITIEGHTYKKEIVSLGVTA